jgi:hypothetical protein
MAASLDPGEDADRHICIAQAAPKLSALSGECGFKGLLLMLSPDSRANLARCQAEAPLIALRRFPKPALFGQFRAALFNVIGII